MQIKRTNKKAVKKVTSATNYDRAQKHIKAAIDILATYDNEVAKDSIANLGVVMFDLMGSTPVKASFNHDSSKIIPLIKKAFNVDNDIASIIYEWYDNEGAYEDFSKAKDYVAFMEDDIYDMLDACTDTEERNRVAKAIGYDGFEDEDDEE